MKYQKGSGEILALIVVMFIAFMCISWVVNLVEFISCDFDMPIKCEVVHGAGIFIPPISAVTAWVDVGK